MIFKVAIQDARYYTHVLRLYLPLLAHQYDFHAFSTGDLGGNTYHQPHNLADPLVRINVLSISEVRVSGPRIFAPHGEIILKALMFLSMLK